MHNISCTDYQGFAFFMYNISCTDYQGFETFFMYNMSCTDYNKDLKPTPCILYSMHCRITSICNLIYVYSTSQIYIYIPYIIYHTVHDILYTWDRLQILVIQCMIYNIHGVGCNSLLFSA